MGFFLNDVKLFVHLLVKILILLYTWMKVSKQAIEMKFSIQFKKDMSSLTYNPQQKIVECFEFTMNY